MRAVVVVSLAFALACGGEEASATAPATDESGGTSTTTSASGMGAAPTGAAETESVAAEPAGGEASDESSAEATAIDESEIADAPEQADAPRGEWVALFGNAAATVAVSSAYRDDVEQAERLVDQDMSTAWNSASFEASTPQAEWPRVMLQFAPGVRVYELGLVAGYASESRPELFTGNRRIRRVRVSVGEYADEFDLDIESRARQPLALVNTRGREGLWSLEVLEFEPGEREDWKELCVSELVARGTVPEGARGATRAIVGQLTEATPPPETGGAPTQPVSAAVQAELDRQPTRPVIAERDGLHLTELVHAPEMDGRRPVPVEYDPSGAEIPDFDARYLKDVHDRVHCYFRLENPSAEATTVTLAWEDEEGNSRNEPSEIEVPAQRRFTHWRWTSVGWRRPGRYRCVVRDSAAEELGHIDFIIAELD